jgi:AAA15 family ATPase/GTPase
MLYNPRFVEAQQLIRFVDLGITGMTVRKTDMDASSVPFPKDMPSLLRKQLLERMSTRYYFTHVTKQGISGDIELSDESDGTQRLFQLLPNIVETLVQGGVYIIDEIESGMHPFMAEAIVKLFNDSSINHGQAQLLFSTHNSNLLSPNLMRRDQIWFVEKIDGCSRFYSLDDFDKKTVTASSPFAKWYLEGRFGAIPAIDYAGLVGAIKTIQAKEAENAKS